MCEVQRSGRNVSLTVLTDWHRLEALVQNHQRASGIEADPSHLTPLHTLGNSLEQIEKHSLNNPIRSSPIYVLLHIFISVV